jgi:Tol biopolymer transport system component
MNSVFRTIGALKQLKLIIISLLITSCGSHPKGDLLISENIASTDPDYSDVTIPFNIAPPDFTVKEAGTVFFIQFSPDNGNGIEIHSGDGHVIIPEKKWKRMVAKNQGKEIRIEIFSRTEDGKWNSFKPMRIKISPEPIDPYLNYRLLYPGYESWADLSINSRHLENFKTDAIIENNVAEENCVNCHSFNNGKNENFLFHMRGSLGGTYIYSQGKFTKHNLKTPEMKNGAVYPRWHPSGRFIAFSSNKIIQRFHAADNKKVEVSDLESSLVLYDLEKNEMMDVNPEWKNKFMDTFPEWSPDGNYIYFCRAPQIGTDYDFRNIKYSLYRSSFNQADRSFGEAELVFDAASSGKSVSFPRISPDGKFIVVTSSDYGTFPIWHKEADLWSINLTDFKASRLSLNSEFSDSYHSWSANGKWLVFSSKRGDGLTARPYIAYINEDGTSDKPFILPQNDPHYYETLQMSFNIPEFSTSDFGLRPGEIRKLAESEAVSAKWYKR